MAKPPVTRPVPFRATEPRRVAGRPAATTPSDRTVKPANTMLPALRRTTLAADGPGRIRVVIAGPALRLVPTDRAAEQQLLAARAQLGWGYDAKAGRRLDYMSILLRNGAANFDAVLLLAEVTGLPLEIDADVERAVARRRRHLARDLAPIPRVVWVDEREHDDEVMGEQSLDRR